MLLFTEKVKILKVVSLHVMSLLLTRKSTEEVPIVMFMKEIQYVFGIFLFFLG